MKSIKAIPTIGVSSIAYRLAHYRLFLLIFPMLVALGVLAYSLSLPPKFTANARLLPPRANQSSASTLLNQMGGSDAALGVAALSLKNPSDLYASLFLSRSVQDVVIQRFELAKVYDIDDPDKLRSDVAKKTDVSVGKDGTIKIAYTDSNPKRAAEVANGLIDAMYDLARRLTREDALRRMVFYDSMIAEARGRLKTADLRLLEVEDRTGLTRLKGQEESSTSVIAELRGRVMVLEVDLAKARILATEQHPDVVRMRSELAALKGQLQGLESRGQRNSVVPASAIDSANPSGTRSTQATDDKPAPQGAQTSAGEGAKGSGLFLRFNDYNVQRMEVEQARREVDMAEQMVLQLTKLRELSRGDETRDLSVMQILDQAVPPSRKSGPRVTLNTLMGLMVGLFLALLLSLTWDLLFTDTSRRGRWQNVFQAFVRLGRKKHEHRVGA